MCIPKPKPASAVYTSPVSAPAGATCFKGPSDLKSRDPNNSESHTWANTWDSLDIGVTDQSAGTVIAALDGRVVYVFDECKSVAHAGGSPQCGNSFGNHVVVLHADGEATFYSHLDGVEVTVDAEVRAGQPLGSVGDTGAAGPPHVHFSVHRVEPDFHQDRQGTPGPSIPFRMRTADGAIMAHDELDCAWDGAGTRMSQ